MKHKTPEWSGVLLFTFEGFFVRIISSDIHPVLIHRADRP